MLFFYILASGITTGALYSLVTVGLVLTYRATSHINFAHGEQFMVGGFLAYTFYVMMDLPYLLAVLLAACGGFLLGVAADRLIYRRMHAAEAMTFLLATVGLSYVIKGFGRWAWGGQGELVPFPPVLSPAPVMVWGVPVIPQQMLVLGAAIALMIVLVAFFQFTAAGKRIEATAENRNAALLSGIRVERIHSFIWGLGGALATVSAVLMSPLTALSPDVGFGLLLKAFAAMVIGGLGSVAGGMIGGLILGLTEAFAGGYISPSLQPLSTFILIFVVLIFRPRGLFGASDVRQV